MLLSYIIRRTLQFIPLLISVSIISYVIIELPPGDILTIHIKSLEEQGDILSLAQVENLKEFYGLDQPMYVRYFKWITNILFKGNFGWSFAYQQAVSDLIGDRIAMTMLLSITTIVFTYIVAIPIGILSAVRQYSPFDYFFTSVGFIGLAMPNFLLALVLLWISFKHFGIAITGLFSPEYVDAAWSLAKLGDLFQHIWVAVVVIGTAGMAGLIRVLRGTLLDELRKQYVITARAKGLAETKLLFKYPVRIALNPVISGLGWLLPATISGATITSVVLNLPTTGPLLLAALLSQDMYLAGSIVMILSFLILTGNLLSDIILAWIDPRIEFKGIEG